MTHLTVEDLKTIRVALTKVALSKQLLATIDNVDAALAQHGLKCESKSLPKRPYQRQRDIEYVFTQVA